MPDNDPLRPDQSPFRPPEPQPYRTPDWHPSERPPFEPPNSPAPVDPTHNPWQGPGVIGRAVTFGLAFALFCLAATTVYAAAVAGGGGTMPWDTALTNLRTDLTGPTAFSISMIALVVVMGVLIFGGELNHFGRTLCFIVLVGSILVAATNFWSTIGITGATVGDPAAFDFWNFLSGVLSASLIWTACLWLRARRRSRRSVMRLDEREGHQSGLPGPAVGKQTPSR